MPPSQPPPSHARRIVQNHPEANLASGFALQLLQKSNKKEEKVNTVSINQINRNKNINQNINQNTNKRDKCDM
jgi:hypothetical protein